MAYEDDEVALQARWDALPDELTIRIFSSLEPIDLAVARHVCTRWERCALDILGRRKQLELAGESATDDFLFFIARNLNPKAISIQDCRNVTEAGIGAVMRECERLSSLSVAEPGLSPLAYDHVAANPRIEHLEIGGGTFGGHTTAFAPTLKTLVIGKGRYDHSAVVEWDFANFHSLESVDVTGSVATQVLRSAPISRTMKRLVLRHVSLYSPLDMADTFPALHTIEMHRAYVWGTDAFSRNAVGAPTFMACVFSRSPHARHIVLDYVLPDPFGEREMLTWLPYVGEIESLKVFFSGRVNALALENLLARSRTSLRALKLYHCPKVKGRDLVHLLALCPRLESLEVPHMAGVTNDVVRAIASASDIKHLDVSGCSDITAPALDSLLGMKKLKTLRIMGLHQLAQHSQAMLRIVKRGVSVTYFPSPSHGMPAWMLGLEGEVSRNVSTLAQGPTSQRTVSHRLDEPCNCNRSECEDGCGAAVTWCLVDDHSEVCRSRVVLCPNAQYGCTHKGPRERLGTHLQDCGARAKVVSQRLEEGASAIVDVDFAEADAVCVRQALLCDDSRSGGDAAVATVEDASTSGVRRSSRCPLRNRGCAFVGDVAAHLAVCPHYSVVCPACGGVFDMQSVRTHLCDGSLRARRPSIDAETIAFARNGAS